MIYHFFANNFTLIYFVYGLFFFLMGFAIAMQLRTHRNLSTLPLAKSLYLLAAFGITHGLFEWAFIFIPIHAQYASPEVIRYFYIIGEILMGISFLFLYKFGVNLTIESLKKYRWIKYLPSAIFLLWLLIFIFVPLLTHGNTGDKIFASETWTRYLLGFPAALFGSFAFWKQYQTFRSTTGYSVARNFRQASFFFGLYAVATGLIVPEAAFFPASIINAGAFFNVFHIPIQLVRAFCGMAIAYYVIGALDVFSLEHRKSLEEARRIHLLFEERERICRDLHDGIIQQIYAVGLQLENTCYLVKEDVHSAGDQINIVLVSLDKIIKDLRNYILDLQPVNFQETNLHLGISRLIEKVQTNSGIQYDLKSKGEVIDLPEEICYQVYHIVQEALNNILKHAGATIVKIELEFLPGTIKLVITDNGRGFEVGKMVPEHQYSTHHGLQNMQERSKLIGARLDIDTAINKGTRISLTI